MEFGQQLGDDKLQLSGLNHGTSNSLPLSPEAAAPSPASLPASPPVSSPIDDSPVVAHDNPVATSCSGRVLRPVQDVFGPSHPDWKNDTQRRQEATVLSAEAFEHLQDQFYAFMVDPGPDVPADESAMLSAAFEAVGLDPNDSVKSYMELDPGSSTSAIPQSFVELEADGGICCNADGVDYTGYYEPSSFKDAISCDNHHLWKKSMDNKMSAMERLGVFTYMLASSIRKAKVILCRWVYKAKPDKLKSRLVIRGFLQNIVDGSSVFSPTLKMVTFRLLLALCAHLQWMCQQMDVCNAFLNADMPSDDPVYMYCVDGYNKPDYVIWLQKALYGLCNSPSQWYKHLAAFLQNVLKMARCPLDHCLFSMVHEDGNIVLLVGVHVDDLVIVGMPNAVAHFKRLMSSEFKMEDLGWPS